VPQSLARSISTSEAKTLIGGLAQNNHYLVNFSALKKPIYDYLMRYTGVDDIKTFLGRKTGILCSDASLPASQFATSQVKDNFMGIPQEYAHTRIYQDINFTFYVDQDYTLLRIFEGWMDYMSSGAGVTQESHSYYRRLRYPDTYKIDTMNIRKFDRGHDNQIRYKFINAFPKAINPIPVTYGAAELLKVTVLWNFDRYVVF